MLFNIMSLFWKVVASISWVPPRYCGTILSVLSRGSHLIFTCAHTKSLQSCPALCDLVGYSLPASSVYGNSSGKNTGVGCHALLQGIFLTQGLKPGLLRCRMILYCLSHQRSPEKGQQWYISWLLEGLDTLHSCKTIYHELGCDGCLINNTFDCFILLYNL